MHRHHSNTAFTLIELLIVVAIIGILAAIAVPNFLNAQTRAKITQAESNMNVLSKALMAYRIDYNWFPLRDPSGKQNVLNNALTTPLAYLTTMPMDVFQTQISSKWTREGASWKGELNQAPYTGQYGHPNLDGPPAPKGGAGDLTLRWWDSPPLFQRSQRTYPDGRYMVSIGPDQDIDYIPKQYGATYNSSNGLLSSGDIIAVVP